MRGGHLGKGRGRRKGVRSQRHARKALDRATHKGKMFAGKAGNRPDKEQPLSTGEEKAADAAHLFIASNDERLVVSGQVDPQPGKHGREHVPRI